MGTDVGASRADDEERVRIAWYILTALHAAGFSAELVVADDPAIEVVPLIPDWETGFSESASHRAGARRRRAAPSFGERDSAEQRLQRSVETQCCRGANDDEAQDHPDAS